MLQVIKKITRGFDAAVLGGTIQRNYAKYVWLPAKISDLESGFERNVTVNYNPNRASVLPLLCDQFGSDKGSVTNSGHPYPHPPHTYTDFYSLLFSHCRQGVKAVFECGLGTNNPDHPANMGLRGKPGASLRVWREYFPNAQIVGGDIDKEILFSEDRIRTFYVDQLDPDAIAKFWQDVALDDFDLMIDDGLHTYEGGACLFECSIHKLAKHGLYIIEDVQLSSLIRFKEFFRDKPFAVDFVRLHRPGIKISDNNLVVIKHP